MALSILKSNLKLITVVAIITVAILWRKYFPDILVTEEEKEQGNNSKITFSQEELAKYNGVDDHRLFLAVVGSIFDVTEGGKHYDKGAPYYYFVGKDGTRSLVTGNFKDESLDRDHILDLTCNDLLTILDWRKTFKQKYVFIGYLIGRYYDKNGKETEYMSKFKTMLKKCREEKERAQKEDMLMPPCNIGWSEEEGARVWCTKSSGGIVRTWVGVPRMLFKPGEEKPKCVCVQLDKVNSSQHKEYEGCPGTSTECKVIE